MNYNKYFIIVYLLLFSFCLCEISVEQKEKLLNGFIDYYNKLPNQIYACNEGFLQNTQQVDEITYEIEATLKVTELNKDDVTKVLKCTATVQDLDNGFIVTNNYCQEHGERNGAETGTQEQVLEAQVEEPTFERKPDEAQSQTDITSGEQFIAIPRDQPSAPCIGCATHVNPQAAGVSDLANLGVRHLDIHEPSVKHSLDSVLDVERQVQVVNGVRYILTLLINFNSCSKEESENCASSRTCKITILVKPWVKLPTGANYRAILANNCTEEWQYGDNGEVLPELSTDDRVTNNIKSNISVEHDDANASDYDIRVKNNKDVQSQPNQEKTLTDEEIKTLQDQIIPNSQFLPLTGRESVKTSPETTDMSKQHVFKIESGKHTENSIPVTESVEIKQESHNLNSDKKKAVDELLDFFDFSGFKLKTGDDEDFPRIKRSFDYDLQVLSLAKDFQEIKKSIENAKFVYEMAQAMVDYLNEMDIQVKNRVVKNVIKAEEELENLQRFVYVQARVTIPCDIVECEPKDTVTQICNGVVDSTNKDSPQILNTFCYNDNKERDYRDVIKEVPLDDPVLQNMAKEAVKKIELESTSPYAMKINKIVSANTQVTSGTLSKISIIIDHINCNKSVLLPLRINCTVLEQLGSKICEVIIHERHWLKEKKISYTCTDRPVDLRISKTKSIFETITVKDPKIIEMLQEAIQYLETQSNKNNKQKIVKVKSISSQIIAGFLTKIEFVVGYTNCTDESYSTNQLDNCELLKSEGLRMCTAQIWDRSWIMDGRQVEVSCDDVATLNEIENTRKKRSLVKDPMDQSVNNRDLKYNKLANESLKKFLKSSSSRQHYEVVKVDRVAVIGKLIKMNFQISPTNCLIQSDGRLSLSKCNVLNPKITYRCHSKILEQDNKLYSVNCNTKDQKQNIKTNLNELKEQNPSESKYYQLALESLKKYLHDTGNSPQHKIVKVKKVTTQIVSGLLTSIEFIISPNNKSDINTISCHSNILEKHWLGTKDINVTCEMKEKEKKYNFTENPHNAKYMQIAVESLQKYIKNNPDSHPVRVTFVDKVVQVGEIIELDFVASRAEDNDGDSFCHAVFSEQGLSRNGIDVNCYMMGTVLRKIETIAEDPNYLRYVKLAEESLHKYLQSLNSSQVYTIIGIDNVTIQWDQGIKILIDFTVSPVDLDNNELQGKRCLSQIREHPRLNKKHIDVNCEVDKDLYRTKRQIFKREIIAGAPHERDPTNHEYKLLAKESLQKYLQESGTRQTFKVVRIEDVTTQVVSGSLTRINFIISSDTDSRTMKCHSKVWEKPWLNKKEIDVSCQNDNQREKRQLVGGETAQDKADPKYKVLAVESLQKYLQESGTRQAFKVVRIEDVTTQVVSGSLTRINFVISSDTESRTMKCHSKVWEQPWLNKKEIDVSCQNDNQREKRQLVGGETAQDPADPKYKVLAVESLQKYLQESGTRQAFKVVRIEDVTTQVVSGSLTRINFVISSDTDSRTMKCHSKVWEQPWLNKKEIDVSCQNDNPREKRQLVGGETAQDPADPKYKVLAVESLQKYLQESGTRQAFKVVRIEDVTTQVVSGSLTRINFVISSDTESRTMKCHSKVWEQPWLNKKEIDVSCQNDNQREKRQLVGGETAQDPADPKYKVLAVESLQKYLQESGTRQAFKVVRIEDVTTQVVSGSLTRINFVISSDTDSRTMKCHSKVWEQPWLNKKEIDVSCQNDNQREKRQVPGGETAQDPADPKYKVLAVESLQKYLQESGTRQAFKVVRIEDVTTQVVSGSLTRINFVISSDTESKTMKCHSKVWEQPWLNKKEIDVSCQNDNQREKRQLVGGETAQDPADPKYKVLAVESLQKYLQESGTRKAFKVVRIEDVTTQVVSGSLTRINFVISSDTESRTMKCHSKVWEQPWLNKKEIDVSCQNDNRREKRQLVGGETAQDPADPKYKVLAVESLQKYLQESGTRQAFKVVRIEDVTTQVVSGSLTRINFVISSDTESRTMKCHSKVWEQPWLNKKEIDVSCQNDNQREKRQVVGGETAQDPADPKYKVLAVESLQKYLQESGTRQTFKVVRIEDVTTQVVSGSLTRINFVISSDTDSRTMKCHSKVWEQPWLNKKEIEVSCQNDNQREKRQVPGGETAQDPTDPKYKVLTEESLQKYLQESGTGEAFKVVRIEDVTTQVVSGSLTRINFVISSDTESKTMKCHSKVWEQPWLDKKEIEVSCQNDNQREKRQVPGGETAQDPTDPKYKVLTEESLQKYLQESGTGEAFKVVRIEEVTTQVVSGSLTRINFVISSDTESRTLKCHSKVWEQPWLNKKEIDVSCQNDNQRGKRQLVGGETAQDPADPKYKVLAVESLQKYVQESGTRQAFKVVRIEDVTTQVVSGSLTRINFVISSDTDSRTMKCHSKVWEQPWLNKKEIDVSCQNDNPREKRQLVGGETAQDPADPKYKVLAVESLQKYLQETGTRQAFKVVRIEDVTTQVVSGSLTRINFVISSDTEPRTMKCHSEVWEQPWLNKKEIEVSCQNDNQREKRQVPGGETAQDPTDPKYKVLTEESLQKYLQESGTGEAFKVVRIEEVTTQVVSGSLTRINFVISSDTESRTLKCHSKVWEQPWLNKKEIDVSCQNDNQREKRQLVGGETAQDPADPKYKVLAVESLQKYVQESGTRQAFKVVRIEDVTTQVVSGSLTRINFVISSDTDSRTMKCHSKVWEQPWLNKKEIDVSCQNDNQREKRQLVGGETAQDPADPKYKVLAVESLQKYLQESGTRQAFKVVRIEDVTTQVVSGSLTRINFVISSDTEPRTMKCHSEVWEQPWLNKKEIDVSCQNDNQREKRQLVGGETAQDPADPKYKVLAVESLQKYLQETGTRQAFKVVRIEDVTTQVVSGSLTRINFVISSDTEPRTMKCHSEVWEQPWLNKKEIEVSCQNDNQRENRQVPGGETAQDPTDPKYKVLTEESLQKYLQESGTGEAFKVVRIEEVTTQVVAGSLTRINFVISSDTEPRTMKCHSEVWEQPWLNKKEIEVSCHNDNQRDKRQLVGGETAQDPADPKYKVLAVESLQKYLQESGTRQAFKVVRIEDVTTQVVSGSLTRINFVISSDTEPRTMKCHSEVWEQPWLNKKEIEVSCQNDNQREKRQVPGGETTQDPADPKYKVLAEASLQKYLQESGTRQAFKVVRIEDVTTQVVSGSLTRINFVISSDTEPRTMKCHSEVWEQPWLNKKEIEVSCQNDNQREKRQVPGGETAQDPTDPKYKVLTEESLQKYLQESGTGEAFKVVRIEDVTTQVVSGSLTRINFVISSDTEPRTMKCHSEVWEQPWLNKKEIEVSCQNDNQREKRQVPGGETAQDPADPKYKVLAEASLQKYLQESGTRQAFKVVRIESVTTQVVAGSLTRINFIIYSDSESKTMKCLSKIWEQPLLNKKAIDVSCQNDNQREKRHLVGGQKAQDPTDPKYKILAEESMKKYLEFSDNSNPYSVVRVIKVATQVVSGKKTFIDFTVTPSYNSNEVVINCHSTIWEQAWLNKKDISVTCKNNSESSRIKRELVVGNSNKERQLHVGILRGQSEEEQDPNKEEYKLLAQESLRKYRQKGTIYHKVIEVKRVVTRVVSGFKYKIDFTAVPTECSANVSNVRARSCKAKDADILYCHTEIWDRPWLKQKKIDIQCYGPNENSFEEVESDIDADKSSLNSTGINNKYDKKYKLLAEEASEKYLIISKRKYVHKVTDILSVSENIVEGTITKIEYLISPTTCLRNEIKGTNYTCDIKQPLIVLHCNAKIWDRLHVEKDITVNCKKKSINNKHKRESSVRTVRQVGDDDEVMDEDTTYYYADRAVQHVNDHSHSNNLHKLVTIHAVQNSVQMKTMMVRMYIELAETYCLRHHRDVNLHDCEEMDGLDHRLCLARLWPSPDDELVVRHVSVVCDDDQDFDSITALNVPELLRMSIADLERSPNNKFKLVHQGEPQVIPTLDSKLPIKINFVIATTNCSKDVNLDKNPFQCYIDSTIPSKACHSFIWLVAQTRTIRYINAKCWSPIRSKRSLSDPANLMKDNLEIQKLVTASLEKLEMTSLHRYKQRVLQINSHSTKITSGKVTTIDFDVGYTSCLKYEWVENVTSCDFIEHLPRRRCVAQIWERLWINNGKNIDVNCVDDDTPLESHIEFESAEMANQLAKEALRHIEAKYPHPKKQTVVRIFSLEKQVVAGIHYRMKLEVGFTDCLALSEQTDCKLMKDLYMNKFCRVNVWVRPWTEHPPNFRVSCDYQEGATHDLYHHVQAEHLFYNFLTTYNPSYANDFSQLHKRFEIFKTNIKKIHEFNVHEKGTARYGVTRFTDLTYEEFRSRYMGLNTTLRDANQVPMKKAYIPDINVPQSFDWREYDAVTEVKDQGSCGSCWAFSVTGNIEGQWKMQSGQLVSLSEQELVDCDKLDNGCNGGLPDNAYRAIEQLGGLELEMDYPYEADDEKCEFNKTLAKVQISGAVNITTNETGMAQWLFQNGPISIGINANAMQFYMGGISHPWKMLCNPTNLDHGVLIVGYGVKDYPLFHKKLPYWIVKNSWGKSWGEQGYYRVYRGDGTCGVNQMASSAVI